MADSRIFQEMQSADALRQQMREGVLERFRESGIGQALGNAYDSDLAKGAVGAFRDAYRRVFEQGWHGHDVFDGRMHFDNQVGQSSEQGIEGMSQRYDMRAGFYGWDSNRDNGIEAGEQAQELQRGMEMER